jgi:hypothetical protein
MFSSSIAFLSQDARTLEASTTPPHYLAAAPHRELFANNAVERRDERDYSGREHSRRTA